MIKDYPEEQAAAAAKSLQSCLTLCDPIDGSPPGSAVPGILQARTLEWVAISFSNAWKWKVKRKSLSHRKAKRDTEFWSQKEGKAGRWGSLCGSPHAASVFQHRVLTSVTSRWWHRSFPTSAPLTRRATSNYTGTGHHWKPQTQRWGWCTLLDQRQKRTAVEGMRSGDPLTEPRGQHRAPRRAPHCSFPAAEGRLPALLDASSEANRGLNMWKPRGLGLSAANAQTWMDRVPAWGSTRAELSWQFCLMWVPKQQAKASWGVSQRWGSKFTAPLNCWVWLPSLII